MKQPTLLKWSGYSDVGRVRPHNEDSFLGLQFDAQEIFRLGKFGEASLAKNNFTFAVCDGMGGAQAGEFASRIAAEKITTLLPKSFQHTTHGFDADYADVLKELFTQIHRALTFVGSSYEECAEMQTTLSLCWFTPGWMYFGHVGDSRIYHLPKKKSEIALLTQDDTHVNWLLRNGKISEYEARIHPRRNVLQKALGGTNQFVDPQVGAVEYEHGDLFLLCTDGLTDGLYDHQLIENLHANNDSAKNLVEISVKNSGRDNTTALVVQVD